MKAVVAFDQNVGAQQTGGGNGVQRRVLGAFGRDADRFGLTHGDLMPDNVLVAGGVPYVIDFDDDITTKAQDSSQSRSFAFQLSASILFHFDFTPN